jgi:hypothetical protein
MRWPVDRRPTRLTTLAAYETETAKVGVVAWKLYVSLPSESATMVWGFPGFRWVFDRVNSCRTG